ncbi:MAG: nucleotide sugar dehydrogenase [Candidatus Aenigmatarchaeota archaeon]
MKIISIFGLGNIGLPLACIFASIGKVIAADINKKKVKMINRGECFLENEELVPELLRKYVKEKKIEATTDLEYAAKNSDVKIIIVPLIIDKNKKLDFSAVVSVSEVIGKNLKKGDLVIVSTTMPIGATRNVIGKIIEGKSGLKAGKDFYLVYAPEQAMNPHVIKDLTENYEQIIGGVNQESAEKAKAIYEKINKRGVIVVRNCETAELIKLAGAGLYRYVNIALATEIAKICEKFDIDFIEVMEKTNLIKYYHLHKPTIGVGGHCVPVYPYFIFNNFKDQKLLETSIRINENLPKYSIDIIKRVMGSLKGKKIGIFGLSYKGNVKEDRFSPTYEVIKILKKEGVKIFIHDPFYTKEELESKTGVKYINEKEINKLDGIIIATDHEKYKHLDFPRNLKFVFDGKSFLDPKKIREKGIKYLAIGRLCF